MSSVGSTGSSGSATTAEDGPLYPAEFTWPYGGERVFLACSFTGWKEYVPMERKTGGIEYDERRKQWVSSPPSANDPFIHTLHLPEGRHQFKFIVDGRWCYDVMLPNMKDPQGNVNNYRDVGPPPPSSASCTPSPSTSPSTPFGRFLPPLPTPPAHHHHF